MNFPCYALITPVKNEEATIESTIQSVIRQTILPVKWVIVSDHSTDFTDEIVKRYEAKYEFIRLAHLDGKGERDFASVVFAMEAGLKLMENMNYEFIGFVDADVRFQPEYFELLIKRFGEDPRLGLVGGLVLDIVNGEERRNRQYLKDVSGATQFFRRECFELLGRLVPISEGGWDAITCVQTRSNGYKTKTFPDLIVEHLKPRNISQGNVVQRTWQMGIRDYALGSHPIFEVVKCLSRFLESPMIIGTIIRLGGFIWCTVTRKKRNISPDMMRKIREEQMERLIPRKRKKTDPAF
jgi:glycosyltransferase involved in cell wall biosynthesis